MNVLLSWSSGKDSAWALHMLRQDPSVRIVGLLTTFNEVYDRVAMHAVRRSVVDAQAAAAGLPLWPVLIPSPCPNEVYEARMRELMTRAHEAGINAVAFGDLFLEDVRQYRESRMAGTGIAPTFPLWARPTRELAREMIAGGLRARITCLDPTKVDRALAGHEFDESFLDALPPDVDPCAERGEFHTCCYAGPMFRSPVPVETGEIVERDGYVFTDLVLGG
ncbi:MAG TPA: hypothetical protein VMM93_02710 [Vicinamibacterales bacterium]|nr:hypothetical protein [Vicinamibacterales bacterium]